MNCSVPPVMKIQIHSCERRKPYSQTKCIIMISVNVMHSNVEQTSHKRTFLVGLIKISEVVPARSESRRDQEEGGGAGPTSQPRRDQEEGGELDCHEEVRVSCAGPGEIKRGEVVLDPQVSPEEIKCREVELGSRVGLLSLQLFPNGGATDIVFVTVLHSGWDSNCVVWQLLRNAGQTLPLINILLFWRLSTAALVFRVGACLEVSFFCPPFPTRPRP